MSESKKITTKVLAAAGNAGALQLQAENKSAVAIWNLSVLIVPDEQFWFAQGIEINYGAQGDTAEDAKKNFQQGLLATIRQHLKVHGHIEGMLKFAPDAVLREAAHNKPLIKHFDQVSFHDIVDERTQQFLPFDRIEYRVLEHAV